MTAFWQDLRYAARLLRRQPGFALVAMVTLAEGPRLMTNIVGCDPAAVHIGMPVVVGFRAAGEGAAVPVFSLGLLGFGITSLLCGIAPNIEFYELNPPDGQGRPIWPRPYPDTLNYSLRDYGNRSGVWRVFEALERFGVRASVSLNAAMCDHMPEIDQRSLSR